MGKRIRNGCARAVTILLALLVLINGYFAVVKLIWNDPLPSLFGTSVAVVLSHSMRDTLERGDLLIIRERPAYESGDIVTYTGSSGGSLVTHRVLERTEAGYITKGDANNTADPDAISPGRIRGKTVAVIPKVGLLSLWMQGPFGLLILAAVAAALVFKRPAAAEREGEERR